MDSATLRDVCLESCDALYEHLEKLQLQIKNGSAGKSTNDVSSFDISSDGYVTLHTSRRVMNADGIELMINNRQYRSEDVNFEYFDEIHKTVTIHPCEEILTELMKSQSKVADGHCKKPGIRLVVDLKWLIERTKAYYEKFGDMIRYPEDQQSFPESEIRFPSGITPSAQQRNAVNTVLNSKLSYIWGAPGTGKTQFVLATALLAYLRENKRVAVLAPTNNSLEQVLRGLLKIIQREDPNGKIIDLKRDVLRIGIATSEFIREYPDVCEKKGIANKIKNNEETLRLLNDVLFEKSVEMLKSDFSQIAMLYEGYQNLDFFGKRRVMGQITPYIDEIRAIVSVHPRLGHIADGIDEYNIAEKMDEITRMLYTERDRPANELTDFDDWQFEDLIAKIKEIQKENDNLNGLSSDARVDTAKILAMTPQTMMGRFSPPGREDKLLRTLNVDCIFVDEIGYCNVIQTLPLFAFGVPITMLGDHMQLPPVCEVEEDDLVFGAIEDNELRYVFMWDQSALHAESFLFSNIEEEKIAYISESGPEFRVTKQCDLTSSYRFGNNMAKILDKCVYKNGIEGVSKHPLEIICIDTYCTNKIDRENNAESQAIAAYIEENPMSEDEFAILTPYTKQVKNLETTIPPQYKDNILTIHKSQGREWDVVILSVSDNRFENKSKEGNQLRFTSTVIKGMGVKVINTAVSRAKKKLILVCDKEFWIEKDGELIGEIAKKADENIKYEYKV